MGEEGLTWPTQIWKPGPENNTLPPQGDGDLNKY